MAPIGGQGDMGSTPEAVVEEDGDCATDSFATKPSTNPEGVAASKAKSWPRLPGSEAPSQGNREADEAQSSNAVGGPSPYTGGVLCETVVLDAVEEYFNYHKFEDSLALLRRETEERSLLWRAGGGMEQVPPQIGGGVLGDFGSCFVAGELSVARALGNFDKGRRDSFFDLWCWVVPESQARSPTGCALELRLRVHFCTFRVRRALAEAAGIGNAGPPDETKSVPSGVVVLSTEPDYADLKAFLSAHPATTLDQSGEALAPLFAMPFVTQPHTRPGFKFVFEDAWVHKLRADLCDFLLAQATARYPPALKTLAMNILVARGPKVSPPPACWHELVRIADQGLLAADVASRNPTGQPNLELLKEIALARRRLAALLANPVVPPPSALSGQDAAVGSANGQPVISSLLSSPLGVPRLGVLSADQMHAPVLHDRLWSLTSEVDVGANFAGRSPKRLHSARSLESRARTATAILPVPPGLDFGRIAEVIVAHAAKPTLGAVAQPPLAAVLRAVLRRLALPEEPVRPRRAFLAAFACFGALRALAGRLRDIVAGSDAQLTELSLAVLSVCACEAIGRREIEAAEMQRPLVEGCLHALVTVLTREPVTSPTHMQCLAVLQRLSLRRHLQAKMIDLGVIDWILQTLAFMVGQVDDPAARQAVDRGNGSTTPDTPDFSAEFISALLMNLMLRSAGRRRCGEAGGIAILVQLIEHPNTQVCTHVNGTLYMLLGVPCWRAAAEVQGARAAFRAALERTAAIDGAEEDPRLQQLEYLLLQMDRSGSSCGGPQNGCSPRGDGDDSGSEACHEDGHFDGDDGDNFLDEEELAAHFLIKSTPCDDMDEDSEAAAAAAAAEAAAAEEMLRPFRATPAVADVQQRRFHAFIARNCRNLVSPKRRNSAGLGLGLDAMITLGSANSVVHTSTHETPQLGHDCRFGLPPNSSSSGRALDARPLQVRHTAQGAEGGGQKPSTLFGLQEFGTDVAELNESGVEEAVPIPAFVEPKRSSKAKQPQQPKVAKAPQRTQAQAQPPNAAGSPQGKLPSLAQRELGPQRRRAPPSPAQDQRDQSGAVGGVGSAVPAAPSVAARQRQGGGPAGAPPGAISAGRKQGAPPVETSPAPPKRANAAPVAPPGVPARGMPPQQPQSQQQHQPRVRAHSYGDAPSTHASGPTLPPMGGGGAKSHDLQVRRANSEGVPKSRGAMALELAEASVAAGAPAPEGSAGRWRNPPRGLRGSASAEPEGRHVGVASGFAAGHNTPRPGPGAAGGGGRGGAGCAGPPQLPRIDKQRRSP